MHTTSDKGGREAIHRFRPMTLAELEAKGRSLGASRRNHFADALNRLVTWVMSARR